MWDKRKLKGFEPGLYYSKGEIAVSDTQYIVGIDTLSERECICLQNQLNYMLVEANKDFINAAMRRYEKKLGINRDNFDTMTKNKITQEIIKDLGWEKYNK